MPEIIVIAHNIRSTHNVGAIFRTGEGFGVSRIILSGYTPYPELANDSRLPHIRQKLSNQIHKTALGTEKTVAFEYHPQPDLEPFQKAGFTIVGLEQDSRSVPLHEYRPPQKIVLILGEEVDGLSLSLREMCDEFIEIPMSGQKESFNVSVATGVALYHLAYAQQPRS